jgi:hypothetical protein
MTSSIRPSILRFVGLWLIVGACVSSRTAGGAESERTRLISATDGRIVFQIDLSGYALAPSSRLEGTQKLEINGFGGFSEPGRPSLPGRVFLVGIPPSGEPAVSWTAVRTERLGTHRLEPVPFPVVLEDENGAPFASEEYRIDPAVYETGASAISVSTDAIGRLRHQRILPVRVNPVAYDPSTGETVIATLMRVEVTLSAGKDSAPRMGGREPIPVRDAAIWDRLYNRVLVNPDQSAKWRAREGSRPIDLSQGAATSLAVSGPLVKMLVRDTGLHRVSAATVAGKGFPSGTAVSDLRVFKRSYDPGTLSEKIVDVAFRVVEDPALTNGVYDGSDWIVFFGKSLREDELQEDPLEKFSASNVYWLGESGGLQMPAVPTTPGFVSADTASAVFPVSDYFEEDNIFFEGTPPGEKEFYYYNEWYITSALSVPFTTTSIDPNGTFLLKARLLGGKRELENRVVDLSIRNSRGIVDLNDATVLNKNVVSYTSQVLSGSVIDDGVNTFRVDMTPDRDTLKVLLDWISIEYRARYRAKGNVLEFNSASLLGDTSITVTGLTRTDVMLFDVTDAYGAREYTLTPAHFTDTGVGYAVSFREGFASQKKFVLAPLDGIHQIGSSDVVQDTPSALIGSSAEGGVDILVVSHGDFSGEMERWVGYRRAQGYRVLMADPQDIFDEFSGGVENPRGIKKFIKHFFETGGASFVLLVGDASEDNRHANPSADKNFVPTESFSEYVGGGFNQDEVVTTDNWYALLDHDFIADDSPAIGDFYPDLLIGRLPVGTVAELRNVLDKVFAFEAPEGDDFWRRRMIRVADNAFSGAGTLCYQGSEVGFETAEETAAQKTENAIPGGFDIVRFYLANYLSEVEPASGCESPPGLLTNATRSAVTPALIGELNAGASIVSFQAHMNRYQICHEWLFTTSQTRDSDHQRLTNSDRPWVVFGFGCHMSDYAPYNETALFKTNPPTGDSFSELLLNQRAGAVATYASSGFEWLTPNAEFSAIITDAFFDDVPTDTLIASDKAQARWILGELLMLAELENLAQNPSGSGGGAVGQMKRYHNLGDPVLRIDAGPPRFSVTVNGAPFTSGDLVAPDADNMIHVSAVVTDEVAIEKLSLEIDGADSTDILTVTPVNDQDLSASRQYEVSFAHRIEAKRYDIILRAYQAEDTTSGKFHIAAEFVMKVQAVAELAVNGRPVYDGDLVPPQADYEFKVALPVFVEESKLRVETDGVVVSPVRFFHPSPEDTTTWLASFRQDLPDGAHEVVLFVGEAEFPFTVVVGTRAGLFDLIAFPNPFEDEVDFVFTNEVAIARGAIDVFTVSGKKVAHIEVAPGARAPGQNAVRWDGRTFDGDEVANGVYLFVASVEQDGRKTTQRGKLIRAK